MKAPLKGPGWVTGFLVLIVSGAVRAQYYELQPVVEQALLLPDRSYYVKPVFGFMQSRIVLEGNNRFTKPRYPDTYKRTYGLMVGYHTKAFEIETGIMNASVYAGYFFPVDLPNRSLTGVGHGIAVGYTQLPLKVQYTIWKPTRRWEFRIVGGLGFNLKGEDFGLLKPSTSIVSVGGQGGLMHSVQSNYSASFRAFFLSGATGIMAHYRLQKRFSGELQLQQLFSSRAIGAIDARIEQTNDPVIYKVRTMGGANGITAIIGLAYHF